MEGIAFGALLAIGFRFRGPWIPTSVIAIGIVPLLLRGGPNGFAMTVIGVTLIAILFAVLLQAVIEPSREDLFGMRVLRSEPLTLLGKYSYAIYLLHMLLLAAAVRLQDSRDWPPTLLFVGGIAGSYFLGWLSWRVFESRVLLLKRYFVQP
jgi:peptidoglycan/LPS O-acetylase OafA/YrhL